MSTAYPTLCETNHFPSPPRLAGPFRLLTLPFLATTLTHPPLPHPNHIPPPVPDFHRPLIPDLTKMDEFPLPIQKLMIRLRGERPGWAGRRVVKREHECDESRTGRVAGEGGDSSSPAGTERRRQGTEESAVMRVHQLRHRLRRSLGETSWGTGNGTAHHVARLT
jgi:hypothetical protein